MKTLDTEYKKMKEKLSNTLSQQENLCITADVWSSRCQSYLGVTVHFLNKEFKRESYVLAFKQILVKQTYKELAKAMDQIFTDFGIKKCQIRNIVTDGGSNFCKLFKIYGNSIDAVVTTYDEEVSNDEGQEKSEVDDNLNEPDVVSSFMTDVYGEPFFNEILSFDAERSDDTSELSTSTHNDSFEIEATSNNEFDSYFGQSNVIAEEDESVNIEMPPQRRCVSHLLNRISHDFENRFLAKVPKTVLFQTLGKLHTLWVLTHRSSHAKSICKTILGKVLKIHCETRWNSRFDAVKMCNEADIKKNLNKLIQQLKTDLTCISAQNLQIISPRDFAIIEDYITVFQPVAIALDRMQNEFNSSQGYIIPVLSSMKNRVEKINEMSPLIKDFKRAMLDSINYRFKNIFLFDEHNKDLLLAAITLPRIKTSFIEHDDDIIYTKNLLIAECKKMKNDILEQVNTPHPEHIPDDDFIISYSSSRDVRRNSIDNEIESEISRFLCDVRNDTSVLNEYPNVRAAYFRFNTTITSSAPVERVFSQSMMIFTPRRNRLSALRFEQALLMKHNRKLLIESKRVNT